MTAKWRWSSVASLVSRRRSTIASTAAFDEADAQVGVGGEQLAHTSMVARHQILDDIRALLDLVKKRIDGSTIHAACGELVELDQHRRRHDPHSTRFSEELHAGGVIAIVAVEGGPQRASVHDQRNGSGSKISSLAKRARLP